MFHSLFKVLNATYTSLCTDHWSITGIVEQEVNITAHALNIISWRRNGRVRAAPPLLYQLEAREVAMWAWFASERFHDLRYLSRATLLYLGDLVNIDALVG